ncbi:MAG: STAS domain-containing protein [Intrasporangium sp.]|uniref:STAS domain-containing protein n=1 Tax=Intrasporangium sp. TaxID=1925024 RepID=UPI003F811001
MDLSINRADQGDRTVVSLGGEIDVYTAPFVRERLDEAVHEGRTNLIVDLTGVRFLDSTGLGVLVGRLKLTRSLGGSLRLVGTDERVLKVFAITGLDKVFEIHPTLDEALAAAEADVAGTGTTGTEEGRGGAGQAGAGRAQAAAGPGRSGDSGA